MGLGRAISAVAPDLWESMRPGFYSRARINVQHERRMADFIATGEYEDLGCEAVTRLVRLYRRLQTGAVISAIGAVLMVIWSVS